METNSILDKILQNQKAEEVASLDAVEIINNLFNELSERERDVLIRRYGLYTGGKETLESIGSAHNLTRERIRQIETTGVKKLQQLENLENYVNSLKKIIYQLLEEHGGMMEKHYLLDILVRFSVNGFKSENINESKHKNYLNFLITKLLAKEFEELTNSKYFMNVYKLKFQDIEHLEEILVELLTKINEKDRIFTTEEIINLIYELESYKRHQEKLNINYNLDISKAFKSNLYQENIDLINRNKVLYSLLKAAKDLHQNKFGHWGLRDSRKITPKTINDKIYLILKRHNQPMHFAEIADKINEINFDNKKANAATVHNELILDDNYVLVGRGLYGLKERGYNKGTVADVITEILAEEKKPITRDEIIARVLAKRMVKKATIILALMNKDKYLKMDNNKYFLKAS